MCYLKMMSVSKFIQRAETECLWLLWRKPCQNYNLL